MTKGYIPVLGPSATGDCHMGERNLYRSHFKFPNSLAKAGLIMNPPKASKGQIVAVRVLPGADAPDLADYHLQVQLPKGLSLMKPSVGAKYDAQAQSLTWHLPDLDKKVTYQSLHAISVVGQPSGWLHPERALGPYHNEVMIFKYLPPIPSNIMEQGARFYPNSDAWFKMSPPNFDAKKPGKVAGVFFKIQCRVGGHDFVTHKDVDPIFMNYSVGDGMSPALKQDVQISHAVDGGHWSVGYYDATLDRTWTWADLSRLKVKLSSHPVARPDQGAVLSILTQVRTSPIEDFSPLFYVQVTDPSCAKLPMRVNVIDPVSNVNASDIYYLEANAAACPPPTALPTPLPTRVVPVGQPTPTPAPLGKRLNPTVVGLGCISNAPEPFKQAGTFIYFCLKVPAQVALEVHAKDGKTLRRTDYLDFRQGNNQLFFNGMDDQDRPLPPGSYSYLLKAKSEDAFADYNGNFSRVPEKRR